MLVEPVEEDIKREVWKRDEFTCRYCGRTTSWEEVNLVFDVHPEKGGETIPSNMLTVCSTCLQEGKTAPVEEREKQKLLSIIRELVCYTDLKDEIIFEMDHEQEMERLNSKIDALKEDNSKLSSAIQQRERIAITYKQKMDRAFKDLENFKKRQESDIELRVGDGTRKVLMAMISTMDDMDRAIFEARKDDEIKQVANMIAGLKMIRKAMMDRITSQNVEVIDPVNEQFDPRYHETISSIDEKSVPRGTILEVLQAGYMHNSHLLRPAKVIISEGGPKPERIREELEEFELDDETDDGKVLPLEPWTPGGNDDEFVIRKPGKKKLKRGRKKRSKLA
jgi:molecular chaperone GrpE